MGQRLDTLKGHSGVITTVTISPDGQTLASGSENSLIKLWNLASRTELCTLEGHTADVKALVFSTDGRTLVSSSTDTTIKVWGAL